MADDDAFLSRWARRKAQVRQGLTPPEPPRPVAPPSPASRVPGVVTPVASPVRADAPAAEPVDPPAPPAPTLEDVARLPADAPDYSRFVAPGVGTDVKNAALKKLFTDPHFNVMDGLDIYIDDYSKPDPLPPEMLRQMVQGRFLGLFDDEPKDDAAADDVPDGATPPRPPEGRPPAADAAADPVADPTSAAPAPGLASATAPAPEGVDAGLAPPTPMVEPTPTTGHP